MQKNKTGLKQVNEQNRNRVIESEIKQGVYRKEGEGQRRK